MHHFFLILLQQRHLVYLFCASLFTIGAISLGFQPYFENAFSKLIPLAIMASALVFGFSYTAFIRQFGPHRALSSKL